MKSFLLEVLIKLYLFNKGIMKRLTFLAVGIIILELLLRAGGFIYLHVKDSDNGIVDELSSSTNAYRILALGESTTEGGGELSCVTLFETGISRFTGLL